MNIVMMTNTYTPHVGGVARSVASFAEAFRDQGHRVLIVAPVFPDMPADEPDVARIPAIQNFNGSDFSVVLPVPGKLDEALDAFAPDIIHAHHPFLIGSTALRIAAERGCPLVFTHHTLYEAYTHYVPGDSAALKRFVIELSTYYANSCDAVFAPSESVAELLIQRGVHSALQVVPSGIDIAAVSSGDGVGFRRRAGISPNARVIGHVGRLAAEKNLAYLADAFCQAAQADPGLECLIVGEGSAAEGIDQRFAQQGLSKRLHRPGALVASDLADAYAAMDSFGFASHTETQGMVLAEAMAAGLPVIALDAPGAREIVRDQYNGRLLAASASTKAFAHAIFQLFALSKADWRGLSAHTQQTASAFSIEHAAQLALGAYANVLKAASLRQRDRDTARAAWQGSLRRVQAEWSVLSGMARAAGKAIGGDDDRAMPIE